MRCEMSRFGSTVLSRVRGVHTRRHPPPRRVPAGRSGVMPGRGAQPSNATSFVAVGSATAIGLLGLACGLQLIRQRSSNTKPLQISARLSAAISGLLAGLSLLVLLPSAMDSLHELGPGHRLDRVLLCYCLGMVFPYFFHHVVLGHSCAMHHAADEPQDSTARPSQPLWAKQGGGKKKSDGCKPLWATQGGKKNDGCSNDACYMCPDQNLTPDKAPPYPPSSSGLASRVLSRAATTCAVLLRVSAWAAHALLDGYMLGSAQSLSMVGAVALPVGLCAMQDSTSLVIGYLSRGETKREALASLLLLGACFPIGAGGAILLVRFPFAVGGAPHLATLLHLKAFTAGIFLYMAIFEFAPPTPHGRMQSLSALLAFCTGLALAWTAEAFEDTMATMATPPPYAASHALVLDTDGHWARVTPAHGQIAKTLMPIEVGSTVQ